MLAGKSNLGQCYSLLVLQAQLRSTVLCPHNVPTHTNRTGSHGSPVCDGHRLGQVTRLSYSALLSASSRQRGAKFLRPRLKPKFRQRTPSENDVFITALKEAEAQYEAQTSSDVAGGKHDDHVPLRMGIMSESDLTSSFFAIPDVDIARTSQYRREGSGADIRTKRPDGVLGFTSVSRNEVDTVDLENELYYLSQNDPHPTAIHNILIILIRDRKVKPTSQHYEALILANTWPEYGSVGNVENVLAEMEKEGFEVGANIVTAVLKVLAVHPSPKLSRRIMLMVEQRWIQLSSQTQHHLILATIRTGQTELGAWMLDALRDKEKSTRSWDRDVIPDYLVVLLFVEMVKIQDWEGILRYMYKLRNRRAADREIPVKFWGWLLERAARAARYITEFLSSEPGPSCQNSSPPRDDNSFTGSQDATNIQLQQSLSNPAYHLTEHLFTHYVANMSHRPSYTTLLDILHSAANTGTCWLAKSVLATMTYMDGIDETGRPITHISDEVKALVARAEERALANETDEEKAERARKEVDAREKKKLDEEDEAWWKDLMDQLEEEEKTARGTNAVENSTRSEPSRPTHATDPSSKISQSKSTSASESKHKPDSSHITPNTTPPSTARPYFALDRATVPPGNLWPLFPRMPGLQPHTYPDGSINLEDFQSAHVDPWDALGPRMSARRKWTDAQVYYKAIERAGRKKS